MADAARWLNGPAEDVEAVLARLADVASRTIPDVDMASVSVATRAGINTMAATDEAARELDRLQYDLQQGPCVDALLDPDKAEVVVADMAYDRRWPEYAQAAAGLGFQSQMGVRLFSEPGRVGGLNLYSQQMDAFDAEARATAEIFAVHAAVAMDKVRTVTSLSDALASRQIIGEAIGIVMHTYTINETAAFNYLVRVSQTTNTKVRDVAARIVDAVVAEAKDRSGSTA